MQEAYIFTNLNIKIQHVECEKNSSQKPWPQNYWVGGIVLNKTLDQYVTLVQVSTNHKNVCFGYPLEANGDYLHERSNPNFWENKKKWHQFVIFWISPEMVKV